MEGEKDMRKNNVIWLFASILIVISLVACGNEENPSKSSKDSNSKSNSVENSTTSTEKPKSKTSDDNNQVEDKDKKKLKKTYIQHHLIRRVILKLLAIC